NEVSGQFAWGRPGEPARAIPDYFVDRIGDTFRWKGENVSTGEGQKILCGFGAIAIANVYGVAVPGAEGRAGMAALWLHDGAPLELPALYAYVKEHLPPYARPAFVRVLANMAVTATFKIVKPALQKQAYDPGKIREPLFFRDDAAGAYRPLEKNSLGEIRAGKIRF
ncbi:MAG: long-chain-acyl-CoA synthetase, partial [bacterium]